jgi:putative aminopeptidase FrvX
MTAKNMNGTVENKRLVMAHALDESGLAGAKTVAKETRKEALLDVIAQFGADVTNAYQAAKSDVTLPAKKKSGPARKRKENSAARAAAYAKKIGAEMRVAEIKGADLTAAIERLGLGVTAVAPALTPALTPASGPVLASTAAK